MDFQQWLLSRGLDIQSIETEMLDAFKQQYDQHCQRSAPISETLVSPADCLHPKRTYRVPVNP